MKGRRSDVRRSSTVVLGVVQNIAHRSGDFLGGPVVKNLTSNAEDACSIPC